MEQVINAHNASNLVKNYFDVLTETGYVKEHTTCKYLLYFFLIDFVDTMFPYLTEADYNKIYSLCAEIFSGGDCLLPYPSTCEKGMQVGMPYSMAPATLRNADKGSDRLLRKVEEENLRRI